MRAAIEESNPIATLSDVFELISSGDRDFSHLLTSVANLFDATATSLFLFDELDGSFRLVAATGMSLAIPENARIQPGDGIAGERLLSSRPSILQGSLSGSPEQAERASSAVHSSMIVPLKGAEGRTVAVLNLGRLKDQAPFGSMELNEAKRLQPALSLLAENALLVHRLYRSHATLAQILQSLSVGLCFFDRDDVLTAVNAPAGKWILGPADNWHRFLLAIPIEMMEVSVKLKASIELPGDMASAPCFVNGRFLLCHMMCLTGNGMAWIVEDRTEQTLSYQKSARLERLAEIGQMTAAVAHEIRNPLTSILGAARLIQESPEDCMEFGAIIEAEALKLGGLCDDFLEVARPMKLDREWVRLDEFVRRALKTIRVGEDQGPGKPRVLFKRVRNSSPTIFLDSRKVEQVLINLVRNAVQACTNDGQVKVVVRPEGFSVEDNGIGFTDEGYDRLFVPFATTKAKGTGLGLVNVKRIVEAHNATIAARRLSRGAAFDVTFAERDVRS